MLPYPAEVAPPGRHTRCYKLHHLVPAAARSCIDSFHLPAAALTQVGIYLVASLLEAWNMTSGSSWQPGWVCPRLIALFVQQPDRKCLIALPLPALPTLSSQIRWCLQLQLDNLVTDFQKVTEDLKRRFVVNGEPLIEEGMVVGGSPMGSGSFKRMTGFTLPQRPTMASSGNGEHIIDSYVHILEKWAGEQGS